MSATPSGGHRRVHVSGIVVIPLFALLAVSLFILGFEILKANHSEHDRTSEFPWDVVTLGIPTSATLFGIALAGLLGRSQYERSLRPFLGSTSQWVHATESELVRADRYREVRIRNIGPGNLVITGVAWTVEPKGRPRTEIDDIAALHTVIGGLGFVEGRDYGLTNIVPGSPLAPGDEHSYFEAIPDVVAAFTVFDAIVRFRSVLGDEFERRTSLLPTPGAPSAVQALPEPGA
jgi:hypothetical protein